MEDRKLKVRKVGGMIKSDPMLALVVYGTFERSPRMTESSYCISDYYQD